MTHSKIGADGFFLNTTFNEAAQGTAASKPAKPKKTASTVVSLRVNAEERERLERAAAGLSLGAYIRERLFDGNLKPRKARGRFPVKDHQALSRVLRRLGDTHRLHDFEVLTDAASDGRLLLSIETDAALRQACLDISAMRADLVTALGLKSGR